MPCGMACIIMPWGGMVWTIIMPWGVRIHFPWTMLAGWAGWPLLKLLADSGPGPAATVVKALTTSGSDFLAGAGGAAGTVLVKAFSTSVAGSDGWPGGAGGADGYMGCCMITMPSGVRTGGIVMIGTGT